MGPELTPHITAGRRYPPNPRHLAAMHQGIADHEVHQGRRDAQLLGDVLLRHAMQAIHLEGIAGAAGQFGQRVGDVLQRGKVDMGGFWRSTLDHHVQPFLFRPRVFQFQRLLAVVIDRQVAHDLEQIAELCLERGGDLGRRLQPEKRVLHHIFGTGSAAGNACRDLDQDQSVVHECLE